MNFGYALKAAREDAGLLQADLATRAELDPSYVSLLENNRKSPTLTVYRRICQVLGIKPSVMMMTAEELPDPVPVVRKAKSPRRTDS